MSTDAMDIDSDDNGPLMEAVDVPNDHHRGEELSKCTTKTFSLIRKLGALISNFKGIQI